LLRLLGGAHVVVGSRLHALILAHRLARPAIAISFDRKVDAHMADFASANLLFDIRSLDVARLSESFDTVVHNSRQLSMELARKVEQCQRPLEDQYDALCALANRSSVRTLDLREER
jgi:polysaccharide pyruvyl transferase WcaK-like protein